MKLPQNKYLLLILDYLLFLAQVIRIKKMEETGRYWNFCLLSYTFLISIIQTYRPWTPRRTSGRIVNKKIWRESEAYRNFGKRFDWSLAIKRHIVMAAPIVETIWLVNGFKRHIVMAAPIAVTAPSSVQNLKKSSSRRFDGKSRSLDDRDYPEKRHFV